MGRNRNRDNVNQGFLISRELNDDLEAQLKEKGMRKSDFYRQLITAWVEGKVTIKADKKHILSK
jgi:hypothetical protein